MDLVELKAKFPDIHNTVLENGKQLGKDEEQVRCLAFVEAMNSLPEGKEIYLDAIKKGKQVNDVTVFSAIQALISAKKEEKKNAEGSPEATPTNQHAPNKASADKDVLAKIEERKKLLAKNSGKEVK